MKIADILNGLVADEMLASLDLNIHSLSLDSREVQADGLFIALKGDDTHGLSFAKNAVLKGAVAIVYEQTDVLASDLDNLDCCLLAVDCLAAKLALIADRFYQSPSQQLRVIGVTGTNGKTSCSQFLAQMLPGCGVIGTLGWGAVQTLQATLNTTPDAVRIQAMLSEMLHEDYQSVAMEVSSHGLALGRVDQVCFNAAVFMNFSRDHLDFHGSLENYLQAKLQLFQRPSLQYAVINADDEYHQRVLEVLDDQVNCWAFSMKGNTLSHANNVCLTWADLSLTGMEFEVECLNSRTRFKSRIIGAFNLENILAAICVLLAEGMELKQIKQQVMNLEAVNGRMQTIALNEYKPVVVVDYAHTPDALEKVLQALKQAVSSQLRVVFGCGGNRDRGKRAMMAKVAEKYADQIVVTNDNPRFEDENQIIREIEMGFSQHRHSVIKDRRQAIEQVIANADASDCILIAGKGHEAYQEIAGERYRLSDQYIAEEALQQWSARI